MTNTKWFSTSPSDPVEDIMRRLAAVETYANDLERRLANLDTSHPLPRVDPDSYLNPYEGQRAIDPADEQHMWYSNGVWRKASAGGVAVYEIKVFEDLTIIDVGDAKFWWPIPEDLDTAEIVYVDMGVSTPSSSGQIEVQIRHFTGSPAGSSADILSTKLNIESGEYNAGDSATPPVISGGAWDVAYKDWLRIDVDLAGTGAKGMTIMVGLVPNPLGSVTIQGAKGDPGGVTAWEGPWATATGYTAGDVVFYNGVTYVARIDHTSGASSEPGVGGSWETYWMVLVDGLPTGSLEYSFWGGGYVLSVGEKAWVRVPYDCTITKWMMGADASGSMVIDVWRDTFANFPPTNADSITGSTPPTLSSQQKAESSILTGWSPVLTAGDILTFNIDSCSGITRGMLALDVEK